MCSNRLASDLIINEVIIKDSVRGYRNYQNMSFILGLEATTGASYLPEIFLISKSFMWDLCQN
jgi:hypothetical protein